MKIYLKFDTSTTLKCFIKKQLDGLKINHTMYGTQEILFDKELTLAEKIEIQELLAPFGIELVNDQKLSIIQRIKIAIDEMLNDEESLKVNVSDYLSDKLNYSYAYLSALFSEGTYTSIENYIILRKVDLAKDCLINTHLTLTEIAYRLNYSSVAHLSGQFKKVTGLTPSTFKRIIEKRHKISTVLGNE